MEIFQPEGATWDFIGASPLETVAWGGLNTFALPSPISVEPGDMISWWYPQGTQPSIVYSATGATLNNDDWPTDPIPQTQTNLPDLLASGADYYGPWSTNARKYSIQVLGTPAPATVSWVGGASGLWDQASNWSDDLVPNAADYVTIGSGATVTIQSGDREAAASLLLSSGSTLTMTGGSLAVGAAATTSTLAGILNYNGGSLLFDGGTVNLSGTLNNSAGTVAVTGATLNLQGGTINGGTVSEWAGPTSP